MEKRYQYWSREGIKFTDWFPVADNSTKEKWQVKNKLLNEFRHTGEG